MTRPAISVRPYNEVGVSCRGGGKFFSKRENKMRDEGRPFLLAIEDPQDPTNDLGRTVQADPGLTPA
jgi:non-canonical poly(A) RNA polymerase PAPD5/7